MNDINKIMKSIPSEWKKQKNVNGIMHDTYFSFGWDGYGHPIHMTDPASYTETQKDNEIDGPYAYYGQSLGGPYAYYEASLDTSSNEPRLIFVEKFIVKRHQITIDEKQLNKEKKGNVYYVFHNIKDDRFILDKEINLDQTFGMMEYMHIVQADTGKLIKSEVVRKEFEWSYLYEYDEKGLLMKIITKTSDRGTFIQERGKDF